MTDQDISNTYRFIACQGTAMEYYLRIQQPLIELDVAMYRKQVEAKAYNRQSQRSIDKLVSEHRKKAEIKHKVFYNTMEKLLKIFDNGSTQDQEMISIMIDRLTEVLKEIEVVAV